MATLDISFSNKVFKYFNLCVLFVCLFVCLAEGTIALAWIDEKENIADAFTKWLPQTVRDYLSGNWTYSFENGILIRRLIIWGYEII